MLNGSGKLREIHTIDASRAFRNKAFCNRHDLITL